MRVAFPECIAPMESGDLNVGAALLNFPRNRMRSEFISVSSDAHPMKLRPRRNPRSCPRLEADGVSPGITLDPVAAASMAISPNRLIYQLTNSMFLACGVFHFDSSALDLAKTAVRSIVS